MTLSWEGIILNFRCLRATWATRADQTSSAAGVRRPQTVGRPGSTRAPQTSDRATELRASMATRTVGHAHASSWARHLTFPRKKIPSSLEKICTRCAAVRPSGWFKHGRNVCRDCDKPRRVRAAALRRARMRGSRSTLTPWQLWLRQGGVCPICSGLLPPSLSGTHVDHWRPLARGGLDSDGNIRLTHARCNLVKGAR